LSVAKDPTDRITLIHVVPTAASNVPLHLYSYGLDLQQTPSFVDVRRRLERAVPDHARSRPGIDVQVLLGDPATEISSATARIGADLVVVGGTSRGLASRTLFGTTTARLLRLSPIPMLAVPVPVNTGSAEEEAAQRLAA
jgi:nucleotide-binding universal stress UspA family protein